MNEFISHTCTPTYCIDTWDVKERAVFVFVSVEAAKLFVFG